MGEKNCLTKNSRFKKKRILDMLCQTKIILLFRFFFFRWDNFFVQKIKTLS